jgi:NADPH2:quinone reductase
MKAVWYGRTGAAPDVLSFGDVPTPVAGPGEVRVRREASGVNPPMSAAAPVIIARWNFPA